MPSHQTVRGSLNGGTILLDENNCDISTISENSKLEQMLKTFQ